MRIRAFGRTLVGLAGAGLLVAGVAARGWEGIGQRSTGSSPTPPAASNPNFGIQPPNANDPLRAKMQDKQAETATTERHRRMVSDSDKLLQLATELKDEVDKTTKNEMSVTTIKKAAEIEKLAHEVKERMKGE